MKRIKILIILVISFILIFGINIKNSYASNTNNMKLGISISDIFNKADSFKNAGEANAVINEQKATDEFVPVGKILVMVANATVLIVTAVMAVKWIISNPESKAKLKGQLIGLVISIAVIYGAVGIWNFVRGLMSGF